MIPDELKTPQLSFKSENGEYQPISDISELNLEVEDNVYEKLSDFFRPREMTFKMTDESRKEFDKIIKPYLDEMRECEKYIKQHIYNNNWRKMHHLPIIRRRKK